MNSFAMGDFMTNNFANSTIRIVSDNAGGTGREQSMTYMNRLRHPTLLDDSSLESTSSRWESISRLSADTAPGAATRRDNCSPPRRPQRRDSSSRPNTAAPPSREETTKNLRLVKKEVNKKIESPVAVVVLSTTA